MNTNLPGHFASGQAQKKEPTILGDTDSFFYHNTWGKRTAYFIGISL